MDFAANTHVIGNAGRILATVESGPLPYELSAELDTVGPCDFGGTLPGGFAAHTKAGSGTGELHAIAYYWAWDHVQHLVVSPAGQVTAAVNIPLAGGPMMHDFALTASYLVLFDLPVTFSMDAGIGREDAALHLEPRPSGPGRPAAPRWERGRHPVVRRGPMLDLPHPQRLRRRLWPGRGVDLCRYQGAYDVSVLDGKDR